MNITDRIAMIEGLAKSEASLVNKVFKMGMKDLAGDMFKDAITQFKGALELDNKSKIIASMDIEYRTFVIELTKNIDDDYRDEIIMKIFKG